jgi:hypothetical protein
MLRCEAAGTHSTTKQDLAGAGSDPRASKLLKEHRRFLAHTSTGEALTMGAAANEVQFQLSKQGPSGLSCKVEGSK